MIHELTRYLTMRDEIQVAAYGNELLQMLDEAAHRVAAFLVSDPGGRAILRIQVLDLVAGIEEQQPTNPATRQRVVETLQAYRTAVTV